jgi:g-D-glutamyl-meso-diaminopimelate peptidase
MSEDIAGLMETFANLEVRTIGASVMGKAIPALRLGNGPVRIHFNGSFHANEWITSLLLMKFAEDCLTAVNIKSGIFAEEMRSIFNRCTLWIVPMVNPDGVNLAIHGAAAMPAQYKLLMRIDESRPDFTQWKANIRGVDLNDQFPAYWEEERARRSVPGPGPRDYTGDAPLTEPEARAMAAFTREMEFHMVFAFHSQGEEIYWNYRGFEPVYSEALAERLANASGYKAVRLTGSDAGYKDWFIQEFRCPGFTVEVGRGTNPLPLKQFNAIYRRLAKLMLHGLMLPVPAFDGTRDFS